MGITTGVQAPPAPQLRRLTLAVLGLHLLLTLYVLWRTAVLTPYADELDWLVRWRGLQADHDWARYLFAPVSFHRIPWTFGLIALDIRAFGGTNAPLILSGALALGVMAWTLGREAALAAPAGLRLAAAALAAELSLLAIAVLDASQPICVDYTHGAVFAVLAIVLAEGRPREGLGFRAAAALACAAAAGLGDAAGLAVWPALAWGALRRRDWSWLAAVLAAGAAFLAVYAAGQGHEARVGALAAARRPLDAARLALGYLLLPWSRLFLGFAWIGGIALGGAGLAAVLLRGGAGAPRSERIACALILFSLGTALMTGLGRTGLEDPADVPMRYSVLLTPLHAGFLLLLLGETRCAAWRTRLGPARRLLVAAVVLVTAQNAVMALKVVRASDVIRTAVADFRAGRRTPEMRVLVHPDFARAEAVYAALDDDRLFRNELHLKPAAPPR